jgi:hypothetical protein
MNEGLFLKKWATSIDGALFLLIEISNSRRNDLIESILEPTITLFKAKRDTNVESNVMNKINL